MAKKLDDRIKQLEKSDLLKSGPVINTNISAAEWERSLSAFAESICGQAGVDPQQAPTWMEGEQWLRTWIFE